MQAIQQFLNSSPPNSNSAGNRWQVTVDDGRLLTGSCVCLDKDLNLVMEQTVEEFPSTELNQAALKRRIGTIMIPGQHIVRVLQLHQ